MRGSFLMILMCFASACTHVHAWERGKLAHPTMTTTGQPGPAEEHLCDDADQCFASWLARATDAAKCDAAEKAR